MSDKNQGWYSDPTSLGLVSQVWGDVSPAAIEKAARFQARNPGTKLGEALVECGAVKPARLSDILSKQKQMRQEPTRREDVERLLDFATERTRNLSDATDSLSDVLAHLR
jgi:hypothetical protein